MTDRISRQRGRTAVSQLWLSQTGILGLGLVAGKAPRSADTPFENQVWTKLDCRKSAQ
jgi:hypothetical protein